MLISRSLGRKLTATATVAVGFVLMYEATVMDFRDIPVLVQSPSAAEDDPLPAQATHLRYTATAYCKGTTTASGVNVRTGIAAADPDLLPVGSVIQVYKLGEQYNGIYTIMDTGPAVQGRQIDIYMWSCNEALQFGRRADRDQRPAPRLEPQGQHADAWSSASSASAKLAQRAERPRRSRRGRSRFANRHNCPTPQVQLTPNQVATSEPRQHARPEGLGRCGLGVNWELRS